MDFEHIIPVEDDKPKKKKGSGFVIVTGIFALVLFLGGVSYFFGMNSSESQSEDLQPKALGVEIQDASPQALYKKREIAVVEPIPSNDIDADSAVLGVNTQTATIRSNPSLDGFIAKDGTTNTNTDIIVGKNDSGSIRGFVSFDLSGVPAGANITNATLRMYQVKVEGEPFAGNNLLIVDNLDFGGTLDEKDYQIRAQLTGFTTLSNKSEPGWKEADITDVFIENHQMGLTRSQYRLRLSNESGNVGGLDELIHYESANNSLGTGYTPVVIIEYEK